MSKPYRNKIDLIRASEAFSLDDSTPSGLRWNFGHGNTNSGKPAGCLVDKGYKQYWQVIWRKKHYYCHRIVWAIKNQKDPAKKKVTT